MVDWALKINYLSILSVNGEKKKAVNNPNKQQVRRVCDCPVGRSTCDRATRGIVA